MGVTVGSAALVGESVPPVGAIVLSTGLVEGLRLGCGLVASGPAVVGDKMEGDGASVESAIGGVVSPIEHFFRIAAEQMGSKLSNCCKVEKTEAKGQSGPSLFSA